MGKKNKANAFSVFWKEFYVDHHKKYRNMEAAKADAHGEYKKLSLSTLEKYKDAAKAINAARPKKDSFGRLLSDVKAEQDELEQRGPRMKGETDAFVAKTLKEGTFLTQEYTIVHFNVFCKDIGDEAKVDYFPAEFGIIRFSILNGLSKDFAHELIDPGLLPAGMCGTAVQSTEVHHIPFLEKDILNKDYHEMLKCIINVSKTQDENGGNGSEPIFIGKSTFNTVNRCLEFLFKKTQRTDCKFRILFLEDLLGSLMGQAHLYLEALGKPCAPPSFDEDGIDVSLKEVDKILKNVKFDYEEDTSCDYHFRIGNPSVCSLGYCRQRASLIMEKICSLIGIELVAGKHVPMGKRVC